MTKPYQPIAEIRNLSESNKEYFLRGKKVDKVSFTLLLKEEAKHNTNVRKAYKAFVSGNL